MIIYPLGDLGYNPIRKLDFGMQLGDAVVVGNKALPFVVGGQSQPFTALAWVKAPTIGGFQAGSQQANEAMMRQLEELSRNGGWFQQSSVYIQWSSLRALPQDGWYKVESARTDYTYTGGGNLPVELKLRYVAPGPPTTVGLATYGGNLASTATGTPQSMVAFPPNTQTTLLGGITRAGAEGAIPLAQTNGGAPAFPNPYRVQLSATVADWFKGRVRIFDTMGTAANPIPATYLSDGFESASSQPTAPGSTLAFNDGFETAGTTALLFRTIGSDSTGTLNYLTQVSGSWSIASNLVTAPTTAGSLMVAGHSDWWDGTYNLRVKWVTGAVIDPVVHCDGTANNLIRARIDGANLHVDKIVGGTTTNDVIAATACALTNGNFYWIQIAASGTTYTVKVFNDSGPGSIGAQVGSTMAPTISDAGLQNGLIGVMQGSTVAFTVGGAFSQVCAFTGPVPAFGGTNYTPAFAAGEPAFCWSKKQFYYGSASLSYTSLASGGQGWWSVGGVGVTTGVAYTIAAAVRATASLATAAWQLSGGTASTPNPTQDNAWHQVSLANATASADHTVYAVFSGQGTAYVDAGYVLQSVAPANVLWRSLGTDATGTLGYWTPLAGVPTITGNLVTMPASAVMKGGHADWWDGTHTERFVCVAGASFCCAHMTDASNFVYARTDAAHGNLIVGKVVAGVLTDVTSNPVPNGLVVGSAYQLRISCVGTTYVGTIYEDAAGNIGSLLVTTVAVISDAAVQTGAVGIRQDTVSTTWGGAFANVCTVVGPMPLGWAPGTNAGEPAFCWSKAAVHGGTYSLSVFNAASGGQGLWQFVLQGYVNINGATLAGWLRGTGSPSSFFISSSGFNTSTPTIDSAFHQVSGTGNFAGAGNVVNCIAYGQGTYYFDDVSMTAPNATSYVNPNWVEVFGTDHQFTGDCVLTNGLAMLLLAAGAQAGAAMLYLWSTGLASPSWQHYAALVTEDNGFFQSAARSYALQKVGPEECSIQLVVSTAGGHEDELTFRQQRGHLETRFEARPLTQSNTSTVRYFLATAYPVKIAYTSAAPKDVLLAAEPFTSTQPTDYYYVAALSPSTAAPYIVGWVAQGQTAGPGGLGASGPFNASSTYLAFGDGSGPAQGAVRSYAFFAVPFGVSGTYSPQSLQAEGESGNLGTGWSSVVDQVAAASGGNTAKAASGTTAGNQDSFPTVALSFAPGTYDAWFRVRVTSAAGSQAEMQLILWDVTASAVVASATFAANQASTGYVWLRAATGVAPTAGHTLQFIAKTALTLGTDWFIDEAVLVPKTLTADFRGPQDIWQNYVWDTQKQLAARAG